MGFLVFIFVTDIDNWQLCGRSLKGLNDRKKSIWQLVKCHLKLALFFGKLTTVTLTLGNCHCDNEQLSSWKLANDNCHIYISLKNEHLHSRPYFDFGLM